MELNDIIFAGIVEDNVDPRRFGRIKVRVQCVFDDIPAQHIPWSSPYITPAGTAFSVPPIGKIVNVIFDNGNLYSPYYFFSDKYNLNLQDKLESLTDENYVNFGSLLFTHTTQMYNDSDQFVIDHLLNKIKMTNNDINLELKDNKRKINIGTSKADQRAVLGDHFVMEWFKEFLNILIKPTALTGNMGSPILKADLDAHIQKFLLNPEFFVSKNVFIVDNDKVDKLERDSVTNEVQHDDVTTVSPNQDSGQAGEGVNIESSTEIDDGSKDIIQKTQDKQKNVLYDSITEGTQVNKSDYTTSKKDRRNKPRMGKYTADNRERVDRYNSSKVKERKSKDNEIKNNPNYGNYRKRK